MISDTPAGLSSEMVRLIAAAQALDYAVSRCSHLKGESETLDLEHAQFKLRIVINEILSEDSSK